MGAMLMALLNAEYRSGSEAMLEIAGFDRMLKHASFVITGEGMIDSTSMSGKAVGSIIEHAEKSQRARCRDSGEEGRRF